MDGAAFPALDKLGILAIRKPKGVVYASTKEVHDKLSKLELLGPFKDAMRHVPRLREGYFASDAERVIAALLERAKG